MITVTLVIPRRDTPHDAQSVAFVLAVYDAVYHGAAPAELAHAAREFWRRGEGLRFADKRHADAFVSWLKTLPGWSGDFSPVAVTCSGREAA
jgi:hypothetical protein